VRDIVAILILGPIGLIEFLLRVVFFMFFFAIFLGIIWLVEKDIDANEALTPATWNLLREIVVKKQ
jgi:hypothetical protein